MVLIDTHCHLYLPDFDNDRAEMLDRAESQGVKSFYLPGIDSTVIERMMDMEAQYPGRCFPMMGLHPCSVNADFDKELAIVSQWLERRPFVAIGEIGLDFYWDRTFEMQQYVAFEKQIEWAIAYDRPIVIHSREAMQQCIDVVARMKTPQLRGVFHCFGGTLAEAKQIMDLGFYLGIGGVATYKKSGLDAVLPEIGLDSVVLETDAPYLTPVPFRGKRNESAYLRYVVDQIAGYTGHSSADVARITTANAQSLFS